MTTESYTGVNGLWPETIPPLSLGEAKRAIAIIWRREMGAKFPYRVVECTGRSHTWFGRRRGVKVWRVNVTNRGWHRLIHALSHLIHSRKTGARAHDWTHASYERHLIRIVLDGGWLDGRLRSKPQQVKPRQDIKVIRADRVSSRIVAWEAKLRRAETALKKLRRSQKGYETRGVKIELANVTA